MKKRLFGLLLVLCLVFSMSMAVFASDDNYDDFPCVDIVPVEALSEVLSAEAEEFLRRSGLGIEIVTVDSSIARGAAESYFNMTRHPNAVFVQILESELDMLMITLSELRGLGIEIRSFDEYFVNALESSGIVSDFMARVRDEAYEERRQFLFELATWTQEDLEESGWLYSIQQRGMLEEFMEMRGEIIINTSFVPLFFFKCSYTNFTC